jgi:hypothetical protein
MDDGCTQLFFFFFSVEGLTGLGGEWKCLCEGMR